LRGTGGFEGVTHGHHGPEQHKDRPVNGLVSFAQGQDAGPQHPQGGRYQSNLDRCQTARRGCQPCHEDPYSQQHPAWPTHLQAAVRQRQAAELAKRCLQGLLASPQQQNVADDKANMAQPLAQAVAVTRHRQQRPEGHDVVTPAPPHK
jgi:hypothetical protein